METEVSKVKQKRRVTGSLENVSSSGNKTRKLSDSFFKRIISLLKREELV
jgi:hypothetical protein